MFESSLVRDHAAPARSRITLLTISLMAHSAVVIGAVALSIATIEFPAAAPKEHRAAPALFSLQVPPPLGRPDGQRDRTTPQSSAPQRARTDASRAGFTAPSTVPDRVSPAAPGELEGEGRAEGEEGGSTSHPFGVPWGVEDSLGEIDAPPTPATPDEKIYHAHEVSPPLLRQRVDPVYPPAMLRNRIPATVVVRCVIDRNGRVRDPVIVSGALPPFNDAVIAAVRQWRFDPGSLNGRAVESYLDLTVSFSVK